MFILANGAAQGAGHHQVPCQQFSFKRILPGDIAARLAYVAREEGIELRGGASLLARLADGGLRDALSLLDQCAVHPAPSGSRRCWTPWGWRATWRRRLMEQLGGGDTAGALETLARLYGAGKDVGSLLGELSALTRICSSEDGPRGAPCSPAAMTKIRCAACPTSSRRPGWYRCWACFRPPSQICPAAATAGRTRSCASSAFATRAWTRAPRR